MSEYTSKWLSGDNVLYRGETRLVSIRRENTGLIVTELNTLQAENEALRQRVAELEAERGCILGEWSAGNLDGNWIVHHPYYGLLHRMNCKHIDASYKYTGDGFMYATYEIHEVAEDEARMQNEFCDRQVPVLNITTS